MVYRVAWRLVGRAERLLDSGCFDDDYEDRAAAVAAIMTHLHSFAFAGRSEAGDFWWARRSADADLEMRIWIER
jgi:hypothetical protein